MAKKEKSEAAEKIVNAEKTKAKKQKSDKPSFFVRAGKAIGRFFKDFRGETKKIVWPDGKTVLKNTGIVIAAVAVFLVFIYLIDLGLSKSIDLLSNAARGAGETTTLAASEQSTTAAALDNLVEPESTAASADESQPASEAPTQQETQAVETAAAETSAQ